MGTAASEARAYKDLHLDLRPEELAQFQARLWELLAKRTRLYTSGESESVPELTAHRLLSSVCYTLKIDPEDIDPGQVRAILGTGIDTYFHEQQQALREKTERIPDLWEQVCLSTPLLESIALKDTLQSLKEFSSTYDYRYFAHEISSDIDYPLSQPVPEGVEGVDFLTSYLERLLIENKFMQTFDLARCKALLKSIHPEYRVLLINLYEPIAVNAVGLGLIEEDIARLDFSAAMRTELEERIAGTSKQELSVMLQEAASKTCNYLKIDDKNVRAYLEATALTLVPRLKKLRGTSLAGVFPSFT